VQGPISAELAEVIGQNVQTFYQGRQDIMNETCTTVDREKLERQRRSMLRIRGCVLVINAQLEREKIASLQPSRDPKELLTAAALTALDQQLTREMEGIDAILEGKVQAVERTEGEPLAMAAVIA